MGCLLPGSPCARTAPKPAVEASTRTKNPGSVTTPLHTLQSSGAAGVTNWGTNRWYHPANLRKDHTSFLARCGGHFWIASTLSTWGCILLPTNCTTALSLADGSGISQPFWSKSIGPCTSQPYNNTSHTRGLWHLVGEKHKQQPTIPILSSVINKLP